MNDSLRTLAHAAPSIAMLACFACVGGGVYLTATARDRRKGVLLLVMAAVLLGNALIWTL